MQLTRVTPSPALSPFVQSIEILETREPMTRMLLPDAGLVLGFRYAGAAILQEDSTPRLLPDYVVTGPRGSVRHMHTQANSGILLVKFREVGAAPFFAAPMDEFFGLSCPMDEILAPRLVIAVSEQIKEAKTHAHKIALVERFLLSQQRAPQPDLLVMRALRALSVTFGSLRIRELAEALHISQDALEKRFRRVTGAPPKKFASLLRFRRAISLYQPGYSLTGLALEAGYYDQPHFVREFRATTGVAPSVFFRRDDRC